MEDIKKDIELLRRINATPEDNMRLMCEMTDSVVAFYKKHLRKENPNISQAELITRLRIELLCCRRDSSIRRIERRVMDKFVNFKKAEE